MGLQDGLPVCFCCKGETRYSKRKQEAELTAVLCLKHSSQGESGSLPLRSGGCILGKDDQTTVKPTWKGDLIPKTNPPVFSEAQLPALGYLPCRGDGNTRGKEEPRQEQPPNGNTAPSRAKAHNCRACEEAKLSGPGKRSR